MMCDDVHGLLGNYLDDELTDVMRARLDDHLARCAACRRELASLRHTLESLHAASSSEPPSGWFTERLLDRLARDSEAPLERHPVSVNAQLDLW